MTTRRRRHATVGIRWRRGKRQGFVKVHGTQYVKTFSALATDEEIQTWRTDTIKQYDGAGAAPVAGSFADDVAIYLKRIAAKRTAKQIAAHLELWLQALGRDRPIQSITDDEIGAVLITWQLEPVPPPPTSTPGPRRGRPPVDPSGVLHVETIRKRRTTLQSFFRSMTRGKSNPVKLATLPPRITDDEPRSIDFLAIERALAAMPTYRDTKKGAPRELNLAKIRATVIAYTGLPPGMLMQVTRSTLDLGAGTVRVAARGKGRGVGARTIRLNEDALIAFRAFDAADAYGWFAGGAVNVSFKRAAKRVGLDPRVVHLYDLRHSYLTEVYRVTRDLATVARLGLHKEGSPITARYARGANVDVDTAAVEAFSAALARRRPLAPAAATGTKVSAKGVRAAKLRSVS
jgi:integrase